MDRLLGYFIIFSMVAGLLIAGNHFLTDDVGNFSMEKAKNFVPNVTETWNDFIDNKIPDITIGDPTVEESVTQKVAPDNPPRSGATPGLGLTDDEWAKRIKNDIPNTRSVFAEYIHEWDEINSHRTLTSVQQEKKLEEFTKKYTNSNLNWTGYINDVKEYSDGFTIFLKSKPLGENMNRETLFCSLGTGQEVMSLGKGQMITVRGRFKIVFNDPWLNDCEIVR